MTSNPDTCEQSLNDTLILRSGCDNIKAQTHNLENLGLKSVTYRPLPVFLLKIPNELNLIIS